MDTNIINTAAAIELPDWATHAAVFKSSNTAHPALAHQINREKTQYTDSPNIKEANVYDNVHWHFVSREQINMRVDRE